MNTQSLQTKYILLSVILGLIIAASIYPTYTEMTTRYQSLIDNAEQATKTRQQTLKIRNHISTLVNGIDVVMLEPEYKDQVDLIFDASFTELHQILTLHIHDEIDKDIGLADEIVELKENLKKLQSKSKELFEIRTDVNKQYPAMDISNRFMLPARNNISASLSIIIGELQENKTLFVNSKYYELIMRLKQLWTSTIADYRLYLAIRMGSFNEEQLIAQELYVDDYISEIEETVSLVQENIEEYGFESTDAIKHLITSLSDWKQGFKKVKRINHSNAWRQDTELMRIAILPLIDEITNNIAYIEQRIEEKNSSTVSKFTEISEWQTIQLIIVSSTFALYSLIIFVFLKKLLFRPLSVLSDSLRSKDLNIHTVNLRKLGKSEEIRSLIESFLDMHNKVSKREEDLTYQALHDALTSLPNRKLLMQRLHHDMQIANREKNPLSFLMLDLNGFKYVNDTLGHHIGDQLLIQVGSRLKECLRDVDTIARLGGDEFSIILPNVDKKGAAIVATKINQLLEKNFVVSDSALVVGASIGITEFPDDGDDIHALMKQADIAMYKSKKVKSDYEFYSPDDDEYSIQRLSLSNDLRQAIDNKSIDLNFQPKLSVSTGSVIGVEALLRWTHPVYGYIAPEEIIEIAENAALINALTLLIVETTLKAGLQIHKNHPSIGLAINLSVHNLENENFCVDIKNALDLYRFDPNKVTFELTESSMMADPEKSIQMLSKLSGLGVKISVDDFGTGFSSLAYLKKLPVNEMKIDRSFTRDIVIDNNDRVIVQSTIDLAHNLELNVVAEGVENAATLAILKSMNCDICQGYHFSKPLALKDLTIWLEDHQLKN